MVQMKSFVLVTVVLFEARTLNSSIPDTVWIAKSRKDTKTFMMMLFVIKLWKRRRQQQLPNRICGSECDDDLQKTAEV